MIIIATADYLKRETSIPSLIIFKCQRFSYIIPITMEIEVTVLKMSNEHFSTVNVQYNYLFFNFQDFWKNLGHLGLLGITVPGL